MIYFVNFLLNFGALFSLFFSLSKALVLSLPDLLFVNSALDLAPSRLRWHWTAALAAPLTLVYARGCAVAARTLTCLFKLREAPLHYFFLNHYLFY